MATADGGASSTTVPYVMRIRDACGGASPGAASHVSAEIRVAVARHGPTSESPWRDGRVLERARVRAPGAPRSPNPPGPRAPRGPRRTRIDTGRQAPQRPARPAPATRAPRRAVARPHRTARRRTAAPSHATPYTPLPRKTFAFLALISSCWNLIHFPMFVVDDAPRKQFSDASRAWRCIRLGTVRWNEKHDWLWRW